MVLIWISSVSLVIKIKVKRTQAEACATVAVQKRKYIVPEARRPASIPTTKTCLEFTM